jgi:hypothetical protein
MKIYRCPVHDSLYEADKEDSCPICKTTTEEEKKDDEDSDTNAGDHEPCDSSSRRRNRSRSTG